MNKVINEKGHAQWATTTKEMVKVQLFFDSLKHDFVIIDKEAEYVIRKKHGILHFNWPDDTLFEEWMADISSSEQWEQAEIDDEVQGVEVQVIDTITHDQREEKDKGKQPILVVGPEAQDVDMTKEETRIKVLFSVHDENSENPRVEIDLQLPKKLHHWPVQQLHILKIHNRS